MGMSNRTCLPITSTWPTHRCGQMITAENLEWLIWAVLFITLVFVGTYKERPSRWSTQLPTWPSKPHCYTMALGQNNLSWISAPQPLKNLVHKLLFLVRVICSKQNTFTRVFQEKFLLFSLLRWSFWTIGLLAFYTWNTIALFQKCYVGARGIFVVSMYPRFLVNGIHFGWIPKMLEGSRKQGKGW